MRPEEVLPPPRVDVLPPPRGAADPGAAATAARTRRLIVRPAGRVKGRKRRRHRRPVTRARTRQSSSRRHLRSNRCCCCRPGARAASIASGGRRAAAVAAGHGRAGRIPVRRPLLCPGNPREGQAGHRERKSEGDESLASHNASETCCGQISKLPNATDLPAGRAESGLFPHSTPSEPRECPFQSAGRHWKEAGSAALGSRLQAQARPSSTSWSSSSCRSLSLEPRARAALPSDRLGLSPCSTPPRSSPSVIATKR